MDTNVEKVELRSQYRLARSERYAEHSFEFLINSPEFQRAHVIASYMSYGDEPDTFALNRAILAAGKTLVLPRINGDLLDWVQWDGVDGNLESNRKILEPKGAPFSQTSKIEIVVVPALRIDKSGYRLGQGGGYYDRALPHLAAWTIGLVHAHEYSEQELPRDPWDFPLFAAATPEKIIRFQEIVKEDSEQ